MSKLEPSALNLAQNELRFVMFFLVVKLSLKMFGLVQYFVKSRGVEVHWEGEASRYTLGGRDRLSVSQTDRQTEKSVCVPGSCVCVRDGGDGAACV